MLSNATSDSHHMQRTIYRTYNFFSMGPPRLGAEVRERYERRAMGLVSRGTQASALSRHRGRHVHCAGTGVPLGEAVIASTGTPVPAQWTRRRRCRDRADMAYLVLARKSESDMSDVPFMSKTTPVAAKPWYGSNLGVLVCQHRPSPTVCLSRGDERAGTHNDRLGESFPTVRSTCLYGYGLCSYGLYSYGGAI